MLHNLSIPVDPSAAGERLDRFVTARTGTPRRAVLEAIVAGAIRLNGRRAGKGAKLTAGDVVHIRELPEPTDIRVRPDPTVAVRIIHEDADLLVADKPAGQPVHPLRYHETGTLANGLVARYPELAGLGDHPLMAGLVHRIDTDTSGLVLAARSLGAFEHLREQFRRHSVRKTYLALVHGRAQSAGRVQSRLVHSRADRGRMVVLGQDQPAPAGEKALPAITEYRPLQNWPTVTLLEATIFTGVTHQIRCQLAHIGHPIVGDRTYGLSTELDARLGRHFLHAAAIRLRHPRTGQNVSFQVPLPTELGKTGKTGDVTHIFPGVRGKYG